MAVIALSAILLIAFITALALTAARTELGAHMLWRVATYALPGKLSGRFVGGTLVHGLRLDHLSYREVNRIVKIDHFAAHWNWSRAPLTLTIDTLRIGELDLELVPSAQPTTLPQCITLPLAIDLRDATVRSLVLQRDTGAITVTGIALHLRSDGTHHVLTLAHADTPSGAAHAVLRLDGIAPFSLDGTADLSGAWHDQRYRFDVRLGGTLQALKVQLQATGDRLTGNAQIEATPFAAISLRRAQVTLRHLNPRIFDAAAPQADLDLEANLVPANAIATMGKSPPPLALVGPVALHNAQPGSLDQGRLPLIDASAQVLLNVQQQNVTRLQASLPGGATIEGDGELRHGAGHFALQASALDLHALYGKLARTRLSGPLRVDLASGTQDIAIKLAGGSLAVTAHARVNADQIALQDAVLNAGSARLTLTGTLARNTGRDYALHANLNDFNPAAFFTPPKGVSMKGRINLQLEAKGSLQPELAAQVHFAIENSTYAGLPLTGSGKLNLAGQRTQVEGVLLSVAGNQMRLAGGFGVPGERLNFVIDAPALARLGIGLSGLVQADGQLEGTLERPAIDAGFRAERLTYGQYRLVQLSGRIQSNGVPGRNPDAHITLALDAHGAHAVGVDVVALSAAIGGTYGSHNLTLTANGQVRGQPVKLTMAAQGNLREGPQGYAWDGTLRTLENQGLPRLTLTAPVTVSVAPHRLVLGATRLTLEQAKVELTSFRLDDKQISSEGAFDALDVAHVLELQHEISGRTLPLDTSLVLDGRWKFSLADRADGFFEIARRSGDLRLLNGTTASRLDLTDLRLRGDFQDRLIKLTLRGNAGRIGSVAGMAQIGLLPVNGRLMPQSESTLAGSITATIPRLQSIASLAGPQIAVGGSASADQIVLSGTLAAPRLSGDVTGRNLSLTLYDQGVRLHDGSALIHLNENIIEIRQLLFHGGTGTLRASGRIPLDQSNPGLGATLIADHLQLLATPAGHLTVSGQAELSHVGPQLHIGGKFMVDRARFQLPEQSAPRLDNDVVVVHGNKRDAAAGKPNAAVQASAQAAGPFTPSIHVELGLGDDFRFEGSGANLQLAGTLTVDSAPGQTPQAYGTVRIESGTYEAFGAKLAIEHGFINFQGSFANPNVDIVALRRSQDVAAGVHVTGTVRQPRVQLVSIPDLPEQEKLNWLVFGRGGGTGDAGPGQAKAAVQDAALGLLNKFGSTRIAKGVGLDQLAIGSSEFGLGSQQVVSLGKKISNRLFIGYEQSLAGAAGVLKLSYELSQHWSIVVRGGTIAGVDAFYSRRFDSIGGVTP